MNESEKLLADIKLHDENISRLDKQRLGMVHKYLKLNGWRIEKSDDPITLKKGYGYYKDSYTRRSANDAMSLEKDIQKWQ